MKLHNQFEILAKVDEGGLGAVYKAMDTYLDVPVAIKALKISNPSALRDEARLLSLLRHENIVGFRQIFHEDALWYMVMDFVEGGSLKK